METKSDSLLEKLNQSVDVRVIKKDGTSEAYDIEKVKKYHSVAPMPFDITNFSREIQKIELNFILNNTQNVYIQEAINNFISSREPYSVKIFSSHSLPSYRDQTKNLIECPHDYMSRNISDFIEYQSEKLRYFVNQSNIYATRKR